MIESSSVSYENLYFKTTIEFFVGFSGLNGAQFIVRTHPCGGRFALLIQVAFHLQYGQ